VKNRRGGEILWAVSIEDRGKKNIAKWGKTGGEIGRSLKGNRGKKPGKGGFRKRFIEVTKGTVRVPRDGGLKGKIPESQLKRNGTLKLLYIKRNSGGVRGSEVHEG